jgi:hypothetical protein
MLQIGQSSKRNYQLRRAALHYFCSRSLVRRQCKTCVKETCNYIGALVLLTTATYAYHRNDPSRDTLSFGGGVRP